MILRKIVSEGRPGVESAALAAAKELGIPAESPASGRGEPALKMDRPRLFHNANLTQLFRKNAGVPQGMLMMGRGPISEALIPYQDLAQIQASPHLYLDLRSMAAFQAATALANWLRDNRIEVLYVVGEPGEEKEFASVRKIMETVFYMVMADPGRDARAASRGANDDPPQKPLLPATVNEAVDLMLASLSFKDQVRIANMPTDGLKRLMPSIGVYIKGEFRLWGGNTALLEACRQAAEHPDEDPAAVIIRKIRERLITSGKILRIVKT